MIVVGCRESFFVKVELGYGTQMREYTLSIDSGSGITWVNCEGRGPIASVVRKCAFFSQALAYRLNLAFNRRIFIR